MVDIHVIKDLNLHVCKMVCVNSSYRVRRQGTLLCKKKSILVTFSVLIISLCEVKTTFIYAVFLPN